MKGTTRAILTYAGAFVAFQALLSAYWWFPSWLGVLSVWAWLNVATVEFMHPAMRLVLIVLMLTVVVALGPLTAYRLCRRGVRPVRAGLIAAAAAQVVGTLLMFVGWMLFLALMAM